MSEPPCFTPARNIGLGAKWTMGAVRGAVDGLGWLEEGAPYLVMLGARHGGYGVQPERFPMVGAAFVWTLEQRHGDAFTPDVRGAWSAAWDVLAGMLTGMRGAGAASSATGQ